MQHLPFLYCQIEKTMRTAFLLTAFLLLSGAIVAQDKVYRKNGQILNVKVIEIGSTEIKYRTADNPDLIYVLERDRINKIQYENGRIESFVPDLKDPEQYEGQSRKAIKIDFLGPLLGYTQITYEKSLTVGRSIEFGLGIIGAGKNQSLEWWDNSLHTDKKNQFGLAGSFGYKFNKLPDFLFGRTRFTHIMQGSYVKPVVYAGNYSENRITYKQNYQYVLERKNISFAALQLEFGKQWVFGNQFLLDTYWGFGYGFDNKKNDSDWYMDDTSAFNYLNARGGRSPGLSVSFGIKVGGLLK